MRVWIGGVETLLPARWFFCDADALPFPGEHGAEASPWLKQYEVNDDWGEVAEPRTLDRGINPGYPGQCHVGDPQWFVDGHLPADFATYTAPVLTPCCGYIPPASDDPRCPQAPINCMPYYTLGAGLGASVTTSAGTFAFGNVPGGGPYWCHIGSPTLPLDILFTISSSGAILGGCLDSPSAVILTAIIVRDNVEQGVLYCTFVSYDPLTKSGVFNVPLVAWVFGGEDLTIKYV